MTAPGILWLTRDFRLKDNPALLAAIEQGPPLPVFCLTDRDPASNAMN